MICKTVSRSAVWLDAAVMMQSISTALWIRFHQARGIGAPLIICRQNPTAEQTSRETSCAFATLSSMLHLHAGAEQSALHVVL